MCLQAMKCSKGQDVEVRVLPWSCWEVCNSCLHVGTRPWLGPGAATQNGKFLLPSCRKKLMF